MKQNHDRAAVRREILNWKGFGRQITFPALPAAERLAWRADMIAFAEAPRQQS